jgi:GT2 family glycosyltransferase
VFDASIIICAHNPRPAHLSRVLDALRQQTLPVERWELLLIDNASNNRLDLVCDISWHPNARYIAEESLGVAFARERGMRESSSELVVFVDDDNVLDPNYLSEAVKISHEWPELGAWSPGSMRPEYEVAPLHHLSDLLQWLAIRDIRTARWSNVFPCIEATPWGAGLCVRASVNAAYSRYLKQSPIKILGRTGKLSSQGNKALMSHEDIEIAYVACKIGFGMAIFPELKMIHLIPKERVTESYLLRLYEGALTSAHLMKYKWLGIFPLNPLTIFGLLDAAANILARRDVQRRMYFTQMRAARKALNIIKSNLPDR